MLRRGDLHHPRGDVHAHAARGRKCGEEGSRAAPDLEHRRPLRDALPINFRKEPVVVRRFFLPPVVLPCDFLEMLPDVVLRHGVRRT